MATIRRRGERWQVQVRMQGRVASKTFSTKKMAEQWARQQETAIEGGVFQTTSADMTVSALLAKLRAEPSADNWSLSKRRSLDNIEETMGNWRLRDIDRGRLEDWMRRSERATNSKAQMLKALSGALKMGATLYRASYDRNAISDTLAAASASGELKPVNKRDRRVSDAELAAIKERWRCEAPVEVLDALVDCPIRSGELVGLLWDDLDGKTILVRDRKDPQRKRGNHQRVPLLGRAYEIVMAQPRRGGRVFPFVQATLSRAFATAAAEAGLEDIKLHDLRHEGISRLFDAGWTIPQVALVSGHKNWSTLMRYTHVSAADLLDLPLKRGVA